ncbi:hypothetical protein VNO78_30384 [Psophocarpus tetragonolobus]|uniref:Uncharacterized protein n=1 Tax=Psophocarpus tetragonolobus TaxID=3891 RepID=A0AAN9RWG2_PSOTE
MKKSLLSKTRRRKHKNGESVRNEHQSQASFDLTNVMKRKSMEEQAGKEYHDKGQGSAIEPTNLSNKGGFKNEEFSKGPQVPLGNNPMIEMEKSSLTSPLPLMSNKDLNKHDIDQRCSDQCTGLSNKGGFKNKEFSKGLEVFFDNYPLIEMKECSFTSSFPLMSNADLNKEKQIVNYQFQFDNRNLNSINDGHKGKILGLELIAKLQHRTKGFKCLTKIHGVNVMNETKDICYMEALKKEILEELLEISKPNMSQYKKDVANESNVNKEIMLLEKISVRES